MIIISHSAINLRQRYFYRELARQGFKTKVISPIEWGHEKFESTSPLPNYVEIALPFRNQPDMFKYSIENFENFNFEDEIVYTQAEPWSLQAFNSTKICKLFNLKNVVFTWQNILLNLPSKQKEIENYVLKNCDLLICGNNKAQIIYKEKVDTVRLPQVGVESSIFYPPKETKKGVLFIGRLEITKGILTILEAIPKVLSQDRKVKFSFAGKGTFSLALSELKKKYPENINFLSYIPYSLLNTVYWEHNLLLVPSITTPFWMEQSAPYVSLEAQMCGLNVITTPSGAIPEYNEDRVFYIPENNSEALAKAILKLKDKELNYENAKIVKNKYSNVKIAQELIRILEEKL